MSCFQPLPATRSLCNPQKVIVGKRSQRFAPVLLPSTGELIEPFKIPCGRCLGCRIDKSIDWATRLSCEVLEHSPDECYFLTLTYDNDHVPTATLPDGSSAMTLSSNDVTLFIKRFRSRFPDSTLRYFYCGEYGPRTYRPHYHFISLGIRIPDLVPYSRNFQGDLYFTSRLMDELWPHGHTIIGDVTWESCAYVARYTTKKLGNGPDFERAGLYPEFARMSRRPGIGSSYFDNNFERIYSHDKVVLPSTGNLRSCTPPRYFDKKFEEIDPVRLAKFKSQRMATIEAANRLHTFSTGLSEDEYLEQQAFLLADKYKRLKRNSL